MDRYQTNWIDVYEGVTDTLRVRTPEGLWVDASRAQVAELSGYPELAAVIREQPGRAIVREGLADIRHWTKDCGCYDAGHPGFCRWRAKQLEASFGRVREGMERLGTAAASVGQAISALGEWAEAPE